jgi:hypothetical protein
MSASNYLEDTLLNHVLRYGNGSLTAGTGAGYQPPATVYVALFADNSTNVAGALESGTSATGSASDWGDFEITTGGSTQYVRQSVTFGAAGSLGGYNTGQIKNTTQVSFPVAGANYTTDAGYGSTVTHIAIMDNSSGGNVLFFGALTTPKTVSSGDQFTISASNLAISLD